MDLDEFVIDNFHEPFRTSMGPWKQASPTDAEAWNHWATRPCVNCGHARLDHDHDPYGIGHLRCEFCACPDFLEPA